MNHEHTFTKKNAQGTWCCEWCYITVDEVGAEIEYHDET